MRTVAVGGEHADARPRPTATRPSTSLTIVAGTIGLNDGAVTSTNAHGSSTPAENTPRAGPGSASGHTTSTPFASSALARVSPANALVAAVLRT